jgi:serine/threonine-protein kinase
MDTDRNLLFGVLALQADVITPSQFIEACTLWASRKDAPLADLLAERGWLTAADRSDVERLVQRKLHRHGGDARASLAEAAAAPIRRSLAALQDPDVQQSLAELSGGNGTAASSTTAYQPQGRERYLLTQLHARGGIGQVWQAHDTDLGRDVALKELRPERENQPAIRARFLEEGRVTGQLEHPGIVPVYELARDSEGGRPFYTMRFIRGRTLQEAAQSYHRKRAAGQARSLELWELLTAFVAVCNAIGYAHSRGVIHRDLKPQNVILGEFGEVMVLDWGLAKRLDRAEKPSQELSAADAESGQTVQGQILGTPAYMAPEQAEGRLDQIGRFTDVYGLGAVLYEVLTGQPPFRGEDSRSVIRQVISESVPPPRQIVPGTPRAMEAISMKALSKRREDRYASALDLAHDVEHFLADEPVSAYREPANARLGRWARQHRPLVAGAAVLLLSALVALTASTVLIGRQQHATLIQKAQAERNLALAKLAVDNFLNQVTENPRLKLSDLNDLRKELLESALPYYEEFAQQQRNDPESEAERGRALYRLAKVRAILGENEQALAAYEQMKQIFVPLAQSQPERGDFRRDLARSHAGKGQVLAALDRKEDAEVEYQHALAIGERLTSDFQSIPAYAQDLGASHHNLGLLLMSRVQPRESEQELLKALRIRKRLAQENPSVPEYRHQEAATRGSLVHTLMFSNRMEDAAQEGRKGLTLLEQLAKESLDTPDYRLELALARIGLGKVLGPSLPREAIPEFQQAATLLEGLSGDFHTVIDYRFQLGQTYWWLGLKQKDIGNLPPTSESYQRAQKIFEQLSTAHQEIRVYGDWLTRARVGVAMILALQGNYQRGVDDVGEIDEQIVTDRLARYTVACFWSIACGAAGRDKRLAQAERDRLIEGYAARALIWLAHARDAGNFGPLNSDRLEKDPDLEPIRDRDDFKKFLAELKKQGTKGH